MKNIFRILIVTVLLTGSFSCKKDYLDEKPLDFLSTANAFITASDFNASINNLYGLVRTEFYNRNDFAPFNYLYRTDGFRDITAAQPNLAGDFTPTGTMTGFWGTYYKIISECNIVTTRIKKADQVSAADKTLIEAKARFFRGFSYRVLAYFYGDVPLYTEEVGNKTDFVRAPKKAVLTQSIEDLKFAAANLPGITAVKPGEVSNLVANHFLSEVYLADAQYQNAVDAASIVINDPNTDLMTTRFGARSGVTPGDPYWDLFQVGNQNLASNKEKLWVIQFETDILGGGASTTGGSQNGVYALERVHGPFVREIRIGNDQPFAWPVSDYTGGRGVGFLAPAEYLQQNLYQSSLTPDIRNANHNFVRDFVSNNPKSTWFGKVISTSAVPAGSRSLVDNRALSNTQSNRAFYPYWSKATTVGTHPASMFETPGPNVVPLQLKQGAGGTYCDQYMVRLAETYLLRAEAYMRLNNALAATDINTVRARSNASPVSMGQINIDFILDERLRELNVEEKRMITLMRLGLLYDRVTRFNPFYGAQMKTNYNLFPIPQGERERNNTADLGQNPGY